MDANIELNGLKKEIKGDHFANLSSILERVHGLLSHAIGEVKKKSSPVDPELEAKIKEIDDLVNAPKEGLKDQLIVLTKAFFDLKEKVDGLSTAEPETDKPEIKEKVSVATVEGNQGQG